MIFSLGWGQERRSSAWRDRDRSCAWMRRWGRWRASVVSFINLWLWGNGTLSLREPTTRVLCLLFTRAVNNWRSTPRRRMGLGVDLGYIFNSKAELRLGEDYQWYSEKLR